MRLILFYIISLLLLLCLQSCSNSTDNIKITRERISINKGWKFMKYTSTKDADNLIYAIRPKITKVDDTKEAETKPTTAIVDTNGLFVANANNLIRFSIEGTGEIIATDNGDPTSLTAFSATTKKAFNGLILGIVKSTNNTANTITVKASSPGLEAASIRIQTINK